jgi:Fe-S oxidoreductase
MGIKTPDLVQKLKEEVAEEDGLPILRRLAFNGLLKHPGRMVMAAGIGRLAQMPFLGKDKLIDSLPVPGLPQHFSFPSLARKPFLDYQLRKPENGSGAKVAIYSGCLIDYVYPEIGLSMAEVIAQAGMRVEAPEGQMCCGFPPLHDGDRKTAIEMAKANIGALERSNPDYIVTGCPTCLEAIKISYPDLLADEPVWAGRAKAIAEKSWDFSKFAADRLHLVVGEAASTGNIAEKVTYHDPCHLCRGFEIRQEPRDLIKSSGLELVEMENPDTCCGFAGSYCADFPGISGRILENKLADIAQTGASKVITSCPGCLMHIRGGLAKQKSNVKVQHVAEVLAKGQRKPV